MKALSDGGSLMFTRPQLVHSIPGRMRLRVPLLKRLGQRHQKWAEMVCELLAVPEGIDTVAPSLITGTVLLHYDHRRLTEQEILAYVAAITRILMAQKNELAGLAARDPYLALDRLKHWLRGALTRRLHLDDRQRITADVFH